MSRGDVPGWSGETGETSIIMHEDRILVTGASGFIGSRVVRMLLAYGFSRVRCLIRPTSNSRSLDAAITEFGANVEIVKGNLLSRDTCLAAIEGVSVIY